MASTPDTIVLALWPSASRAQISHYVNDYNILYPSAQIDLLFSSRIPSSLLHDPPGRNIRKCFSERDAAPFAYEMHTVLLHIFGHEAAARACWMLRSYCAQTGELLNVKAVVLDSVPALTALGLTKAMLRPHRLLVSTYQWIGTPILRWAAGLAFGTAYDCPARMRDLNDQRLVPVSARRCYVVRGIIFSWREGGAQEEAWERQEYCVDRKAVDDWRWNSDRERYWTGIEDAWSG